MFYKILFFFFFGGGIKGQTKESVVAGSDKLPVRVIIIIIRIIVIICWAIIYRGSPGYVRPDLRRSVVAVLSGAVFTFNFWCFCVFLPFITFSKHKTVSSDACASKKMKEITIGVKFRHCKMMLKKGENTADHVLHFRTVSKLSFVFVFFLEQGMLSLLQVFFRFLKRLRQQFHLHALN